MIPCKDVVKISKERTALVIPNAIQICTQDEKYFLTSFAARDKTFLLLDHVLKCANDDQVNKCCLHWTGCYCSFYLFCYDAVALVTPLVHAEGNLVRLLHCE